MYAKSHKNDSTPGTLKKYMCCGKAKHPRDKCPAQDTECFKCMHCGKAKHPLNNTLQKIRNVKCHKKEHYSGLHLS